MQRDHRQEYQRRLQDRETLRLEVLIKGKSMTAQYGQIKDFLRSVEECVGRYRRFIRGSVMPDPNVLYIGTVERLLFAKVLRSEERVSPVIKSGSTKWQGLTLYVVDAPTHLQAGSLFQ